MAYGFSQLGQSITNWFINTGTSIGIVIAVILIVGILGTGGFILYRKKKIQLLYNKHIIIFKDVNGQPKFIDSDIAREFQIPGTNVRVFHWKKKNLFSAYPTRDIGNNNYAYKIDRLGNLTNFDFKNNPENGETMVDFEQRDQTFAFHNMEKTIEEYTKTKEVKNWWSQNAQWIAVVVLAVIIGLEMWFNASQNAHMAQQWLQISTKLGDVSTQIGNAATRLAGAGSGVVAG